MQIIEPTRISKFLYDCVQEGITQKIDDCDSINEFYIQFEFTMILYRSSKTDEYLIWTTMFESKGREQFDDYLIIFSSDEIQEAKKSLELLGKYYRYFYYDYDSKDFNIGLLKLFSEIETIDLENIDVRKCLPEDVDQDHIVYNDFVVFDLESDSDNDSFSLKIYGVCEELYAQKYVLVELHQTGKGYRLILWLEESLSNTEYLQLVEELKKDFKVTPVEKDELLLPMNN